MHLSQVLLRNITLLKLGCKNCLRNTEKHRTFSVFLCFCGNRVYFYRAGIYWKIVSYPKTELCEDLTDSHRFSYEISWSKN